MTLAEILPDRPKLSEKEREAIGSFNHSYLQIRLGKLLDSDRYTACADLSLDISKIDLTQLEIKGKSNEVRPDICLYSKRGLSRPRDILKMKEMPLTAVEIISPRQGSDEILEKFQIYFLLGIQSCWLVDPALETIAVYHSPSDRVTYSAGIVKDEAIAIELPLTEIFV